MLRNASSNGDFSISHASAGDRLNIASLDPLVLVKRPRYGPNRKHRFQQFSCLRDVTAVVEICLLRHRLATCDVFGDVEWRGMPWRVPFLGVSAAAAT
jgi:hypothetical protein